MSYMYYKTVLPSSCRHGFRPPSTSHALVLVLLQVVERRSTTLFDNVLLAGLLQWSLLSYFVMLVIVLRSVVFVWVFKPWLV